MNEECLIATDMSGYLPLSQTEWITPEAARQFAAQAVGLPVRLGIGGPVIGRVTAAEINDVGLKVELE